MVARPYMQKALSFFGRQLCILFGEDKHDGCEENACHSQELNHTVKKIGLARTISTNLFVSKKLFTTKLRTDQIVFGTKRVYQRLVLITLEPLYDNLFDVHLLLQLV